MKDSSLAPTSLEKIILTILRSTKDRRTSSKQPATAPTLPTRTQQRDFLGSSYGPSTFLDPTPTPTSNATDLEAHGLGEQLECGYTSDIGFIMTTRVYGTLIKEHQPTIMRSGIYWLFG